MSDKGKKQGKKRPKSYYKKCANVKRKRLNCLEAGLKGFIVTCCDREKEATRESYSILNDYADQLYGPENFKEEHVKTSDDEDDDIEKAMKKEVEAFKETKPAERRFQRVESKTKNCIFIKTILENPSELSQKLFKDLFETRIQKTRYAMRLFPVEGTCKANAEEIFALGQKLFEVYFSTPIGEGLSFSILFKARNNNSISKDNIVPELSRRVFDLNPAHSVNHDSPDYLIFVQILCTVCCVSILKDFFKFKKYNLQEIVKTKEITETVTDQQEIEKTDEDKEVNNRNSADGKLNISDEKAVDNVVEQQNELVVDSCEQSTEKGVKAQLKCDGDDKNN